MKTMSAFFIIILALSVHAIPASSETGHGKNAHEQPQKETMGFTHHEIVDSIRTEFQIMSLASMKMTDENGATHHVMVKFFDEKTRTELKEVVGKIKIISPDGSEQTNELKNYGGVYAANFNFHEKGRYGVICLMKINGQKHIVKFWYPHQERGDIRPEQKITPPMMQNY